jgi:leader peptidase (prepilin peptidase)/N-methyltransferase
MRWLLGSAGQPIPLTFASAHVRWIDFPSWFLGTFAVSLGLLFGSFLNVVIYRVPRGQSVVHPPSTCPACGQRIAPWNNVPVLSWVVLRGKAACCGAPIRVRYPMVEALGGLSGWACFHFIDRGLAADAPVWLGALLFAAYLALFLGLLAALFIDLEFMLLPDSITVGGAVTSPKTAPLRELPWQDALWGAALGFLIVWFPFIWLYEKLRGFAGMGLGDAKLLMLAGAWFGWPGAVFALLAGAVQGTVAALAVYAVKGKIDEPKAVTDEREQWLAELARLPEEERQRLEEELAKDPLHAAPPTGLAQARLPFGPFLIIAILEYFFFEPWIIEGFFAAFLGG